MSAVLTGLLVAACAAGSANPHLSTDAASIAAVAPPYGAAAYVNPGALGALLPARMDSPHRVLGYKRVQSWFDDYYQRVHIVPRTLALGAVASAQVRTLDVWNAWVDQTLSLPAITTVGADGLTITAPGVYPLAFAPLQQRTWSIAVGTDGPPVIAATLTYAFTGQPALTVTITGSRLVPFAWAPDWGQHVLERLEWRTDVLTAPYSGIAQRRALRALPRRAFEFAVGAEDRARAHMDAALAAWSAREWGLPVWPDGERLSADVAAGALVLPATPSGRDYVAGGLVLLLADPLHLEAAEVASVGASSLTLARPLGNAWPAGTPLLPLRRARLAHYASLARAHDAAARTRVAFDVSEPCDWSAVIALPLYRTLPVLEQRIEESTDPRQDYQRIASTLDNGIGAVVVDDTAGVPVLLHSHRWLLTSRAQSAALRSLLYALRGQQGVLWASTWASDLVPVATLTSSSVLLDVQAVGYATYLAGQIGRRDLRIELTSGAVYYRRVSAAVAVDANTERLTLDTALGVTAAAGDFARVSYLAPCVLASDAVEIEHATDADGVGVCSVLLRSVQDDV